MALDAISLLTYNFLSKIILQIVGNLFLQTPIKRFSPEKIFKQMKAFKNNGKYQYLFSF